MSNFKLNLPPPTDEALMFGILCVHNQTAIWKSCIEENSSNEDPCKVMMRSIFN